MDSYIFSATNHQTRENKAQPLTQQEDTISGHCSLRVAPTGFPHFPSIQTPKYKKIKDTHLQNKSTHNKGRACFSLPQRVSLVESKAGVNIHSNPEGNEQKKKDNVSAFSVVLYDSSHICTSITWWVPPNHCPQRTPHLLPLLPLNPTLHRERRIFLLERENEGIHSEAPYLV